MMATMSSSPVTSKTSDTPSKLAKCWLATSEVLTLTSILTSMMALTFLLLVLMVKLWMTPSSNSFFTLLRIVPSDTFSSLAISTKGLRGVLLQDLDDLVVQVIYHNFDLRNMPG